MEIMTILQQVKTVKCGFWSNEYGDELSYVNTGGFFAGLEAAAGKEVEGRPSIFAV